MRKRKVLLYGHAGSGNHGCEALVRTTIELLQLKKEDVTLISFRPQQDEKFEIYKLCKIIKYMEKTKPRRNIRFLSAYLKLKLYKDYIPMDDLAEAAMAGVKKGDLAFSIGGDNYCYDDLDWLLRENDKWRGNGLKTVLWGCSIEPELLNNTTVANDLAKFDLITARESISYEALKTVNKNVVLVPDSAFFLKKKEIEETRILKEGEYVGINLSPLVEEREKREGITYKNYCELIETIIKQTELKILLIPHVVMKKNNDRESLEKLYEAYKGTNRIFLVEDVSCEVLKAFISKCRFFIGARTHATIAAYSLGIPTVVLGYSIKAIGIARDLFGTNEGFVVPVQALEEENELAKAFEFLLNNEDEIRDRFKNIMGEYKAGIRNGLEAIEKLKI